MTWDLAFNGSHIVIQDFLPLDRVYSSTDGYLEIDRVVKPMCESRGEVCSFGSFVVF